jgi:MFS family permease
MCSLSPRTPEAASLTPRLSQSNAIIVGVEFSMPGNLLGIPAFLKLFGVESGDSYAIQAKILTIWSALFATFQVIGQFVGGWQSDYFGRRICLYTVIFWTYIVSASGPRCHEVLSLSRM